MDQNPFASEISRRSGAGNPFAAEMEQRSSRGFGERAIKYADDFMRSAADMATFGLADEIAAFLSSETGVGGQDGADGTYSGNLEAERARDQTIPLEAQIPGMIAGALINPIARFGGTRAAATVPQAVKQGAIEGAAYGAAYGAGSGEGVEDRARSSLFGAAVGAPVGGVVGGTTAKLTQKMATPPATDALKAEATKAYKAADDAGLIVSRDAFKRMVAGLQDDLAEMGIDRTMHPRTMAAFKRLAEVDDNVSLKGLETLRRVVNNAGNTMDRSEGKMAQAMRDRIDDFVMGLGADDVLTGNAAQGVEALTKARGLWAKASKAAQIEEAIRRAKIRQHQFSGSGYENALRTEFRQIAMNPKRFRMFNESEREAILKVVEGGKVENALRLFGKLAPTGIVSSALGGGMGFTIGGAPGAVMVPLTGHAARSGATAMTSRNARLAEALMRNGAPLRSQRPLNAIESGLRNALLMSGVAGTTQAAQNSMSNRRSRSGSK